MNVKQLYIAIIVQTLMLSTAWAQGPNHTGTYYQAADGQCGEALKTAFFQIINGEYQGVQFQQIKYGSGRLDGVWGAFATTDVLDDGVTIRDRYSNITHYQLGDDQGSSNSVEGAGGYNREHSFPKSWFGVSTPIPVGPGTDLHHIYPTDVHINTLRSNLPYGENEGESKHSEGYYSKIGACTFEGYTGKCFEPNDEWKGDFARTYFYMVTCYEDQQTTWSSDMLSSDSYPSFSEWALRLLLKWSRQDPVDSIEIKRNEAVCVIQHNRNPFIDYPGLEEFIWGDSTLQAFAYGGFEEGGDTIITPPDTIVVEKEDTIYLPAKKYQFRKVLRVIGGKRYIIITDVEGKLRMAQPLASTQNYGYMNAKDVVAQDDVITLDDDKPTFTLLATADGYRIQDSSGRYLWQQAEYNTFSVTPDETADATTWSIDAREADGTFAIKNLSTQKIAQYSSNYSNYACYKTVSGLLPNLYEEVETLVGDINNDGSVNVADVTALVNLFNDKSLRDGDRFNLHAADANEDGVVTRSDIQSLIGIVLGR